MPDGPTSERGERVVLPLDDIEDFVGEDIERGRARIANVVTVLLIAGVLSAPVLFILAVWIAPSLSADFKSFFDTWFTVLGPVVGTAVGFYFGEQRGLNAPSSRARRRRR
jgi:hypothetical protein